MTRHALCSPEAGEIHVGTFVKTAAAQTVEILALSGMDFVVADAEHAPLDRSDLDLLVLAGAAAGLPVLVRVPDANASSILSSLDIGAAGVLVPHVDSPVDAEAAVAHARYRSGRRGYSSSPRAGGYGSIGMAANIAAGDLPLVICQIESPSGLRYAKAIASVEGVAGIFLGRADLALAMGLHTTACTEIEEATEHFLAAAKSVGGIAGFAVANASERDHFAARGANWFVVSSDQGLLRQAALEATRRKARN